MGSDVVAAVKSFFQTGSMHKGWNSTAISLAPKVKSPITVKDFRPISCCSITYKCIAKTISRRLQKMMLVLISSSQSAFIKGRYIVDNVLMMQELAKVFIKVKGLLDVC